MDKITKSVHATGSLHQYGTKQAKCGLLTPHQPLNPYWPIALVTDTKTTTLNEFSAFQASISSINSLKDNVLIGGSPAPHVKQNCWQIFKSFRSNHDACETKLNEKS